MPRDTKFSVNAAWQQGMGTSIAFGVSKLLLEAQNKHLHLDGIGIFLLDQALVNNNDLSKLIAGFNKHPQLICCAEYQNILGAPAIFPVSCTDRLIRLRGEKGAAGIIKDALKLNIIQMPNAAFDIDSQAELAQWHELNN